MGENNFFKQKNLQKKLFSNPFYSRKILKSQIIRNTHTGAEVLFQYIYKIKYSKWKLVYFSLEVAKK